MTLDEYYLEKVTDYTAVVTEKRLKVMPGADLNNLLEKDGVEVLDPDIKRILSAP